MKKIQVFSCIFILSGYVQILSVPMYFALACDTEHAHLAQRLIESIKETNNDRLVEIAVFNIGLTETQKTFFASQEKVKLIDIDMTHPAITQKFIVRPDGRLARGWYAWKPVALKQALDLYPYVLYMDSCMQVVGDMTPLFEQIKKAGYFFMEVGHSIRPMTTNKQREYFDLNENDSLLDLTGLSAGIQGVSRAVYDSYVFPLYSAAHDLSLFSDDGSAPWGFGGARHDQPLFSILAQKLAMKIHRGRGELFRFGGREFLFDFSQYWLFKDV